MSIQQTRKVIFGVLDWGLGHASRVVPIIKHFENNGWIIGIASSGKAEIFLRQQFKNHPYFSLPSYKVEISSNNLIINALKNIKNVITAIRKEQLSLNEIQKEFHADLIISDNRYGFFDANSTSVFISHQLQLPLPTKFQFLNNFVQYFYRSFFKHYQQIWVPDFKGAHSISGKLINSKLLKNQIYHLGILSRFQGLEKPKIDNRNEIKNILIWLSGPEPARTDFEKIILKKIRNQNFQFTIIRGLTEVELSQKIDGVEILSHADDQLFLDKVMNADLIICRSGYSSIMDLMVLGKNAILIPTPGQTEQEYLAQNLQSNQWFYSISQKDFQNSFEFETIDFEFHKIPEIKIEYQLIIDKALNDLNF